MEELKEIFEKFLEAQKTRDIKVLVDLYRKIVISRNALAVEQGYESYIDMQVKKIYRILEVDWKKYLSNKDSFSSKFSPNLDSSSNSPHFLSKLPKINMEYPEGVIDFVAKKYPEISVVRDKITIEKSDKGAYFRYSKDDGTYSIFIPKTNFNQKVSMFIHELAHIISQERTDHQEFVYSMEFEAHKIEFELAKDISKEFLQAVIGEYLPCLVRADFQISMFSNLHLDPIETYTNCFAKYIGGLNEKNQTEFLFDKKITHNPFVDMPDAVSLVNLLS